MKQDVLDLVNRLRKDIIRSVESGSVIVTRQSHIDSQAVQTAANQFRQAAKDLDQLDGVLQAMYHFGR